MTSNPRPADAAPAHHRPGGGFRNPWLADDRGLRDFLKWQADRLRSPLPRAPRRIALPRAVPEFAAPRAAPDACAVTWVGHSTLLLQAGGLNILTDPIWSAVAGPLPGLGPRRLVPAAVPFEALPPLDVVLVSHDHYDHFDDATVRRLVAAHPSAQWVAPLGVGALLRDRGAARVAELDWWEGVDAAGARVTCVPAQHFSARTPFDRWRRLWCGFAVRAGAHAMYFAGDSGWFPGFAEIGARCGPFDIACLPIGAYEPRWFMRDQHMNPSDAVKAFADCRAEQALAHHHGTFQLTDEAIDAPVEALHAALDEAKIPRERFIALKPGQVFEI